MDDSRDLERAVITTTFAEDFTSKINGVLTIKNDDVIVINVPSEFCTQEYVDDLKMMLKNMGFNNKIVMLHEGVNISLLRKEIEGEQE